jgi:hypothetical protein
MTLKKEQNTISIAEAQEWGQRWNDGGAKFFVNNLLKAFLIPGIDLTQVLAEEGVQDIRTYFGVDGSGQPHLMVVGVDANGNDMIDQDQLVNQKNDWHIYDFSLPCPSTCDVKSPLFKY